MIDAGDRDRSVTDSVAFALALVALFGLLYALLARFALDAFPYSGDEYSLALQGELFARGVLKAAAPPHIEWLRVDHVVIDGFIRSKYPPGAAALLAIGARFGVAWLVTPIEGVLGVLAVWWSTRRLLGARAALVALVAVGLAPLYAFEAATFYAHTATVMFLAVGFACVAEWTRSRATGWLIATGMMLGCTFLTRPVDAVLFGAAMLSFRSARAVIVTALAAVPLVALSFAYQAAQFGSPLTDGYHAYQPTLEALYGASSAHNPLSIGNLWDPIQVWNHLDIFRSFFAEWTVPGALLVALVGAYAIGRDHAARPMRTFAIALCATYAGVLLFTIADPDDGARARYLSPLLVPLGLLVAAGFAPASAAIAGRFGARVRATLVVLAIVFALGQVAAFLYGRLPSQWRREGLYQAADAAHVHGVVIVRAQYPSRYARNGGFADGPVLYLSAPPETSAATVAAAYPDREIWEAHEAHDGVPWTLTRVR